MNRRLALMVLAIYSCDMNQSNRTDWNMDFESMHCGASNPDTLWMQWSGSCQSASRKSIDSVKWNGAPAFALRTILANCSLDISVRKHGYTCSTSSYAWNTADSDPSFIQTNFPLATWLAGFATQAEAVNELTCSILLQDTLSRNWWEILPAPIDPQLLQEELLNETVYTQSSIGTFWFPWNELTADSLVRAEVHIGKLLREEYLAWVKRKLSVDKFDSLNPMVVNGTERNVGACPASLEYAATLPFRIARSEATIADCGLSGVKDSLQPATGLTWSEAEACAQRNGGRLPTLAEWRCARGEWRDTTPRNDLAPLDSLGIWLADSSADGRHLLQGRFREELPGWSRPSHTGLRILTRVIAKKRRCATLPTI